MTAVHEARPDLEQPGFRRMLLYRGLEVDAAPVPVKAPRRKRVKPLKYAFPDMDTDLLELAHRERMAFPFLADNECSACGELVCGCLVGGKLHADASTEDSTFEGSTA